MTLASLRSLSPLGPIFGKELRTTARRKRTYALRFLYLAGLLLLLLFFFSVAFPDTRQGNVIWRAQRQAEMGAWFYMIFAYFNLGAMTLVGPILTSTAINSERLHKTLPVLLMTPISAWQIVCGKLFSRLWIALTLIGLSLPALAVVRLLGGVEAEQIAAALGMSVSVVIAGAALGLLLSALMNRSYAVILLAYGVMGIVYALLPFVTGMILFEVMRIRNGPAQQGFFQFLNLTNPFFALAAVAFPGGMRLPGRLFSWHACVMVHLVIALLLVLLSVLILRRIARKENEGSGAAANLPQPTPAPPSTAAATDSTPQEPSSNHTRVRTVSDNPVLWREIRRPLLARRWQAIAMSLFVVGTLVFIYTLMAASNDFNDRDGQVAFSCIFCGLLTLLACVLSATAIAQEKESDTWTLLLTTPLSGYQIVWGKVSGLLRRLAWPAVLIVAHFLLFALSGVVSWTTLWVILWLTFTTNTLWLATGLYLSLRLKTVIFAVILNLLGPVVLYLIPLVVLGILGSFLSHNTEDWMEYVGLYAPYTHMAMAIDYLDRPTGNYDYYSYARNTFSYFQTITHRTIWIPVFKQVSVLEFLKVVLVVGLAHLALAGLIVWHTAKCFNSIVGRATQQRGKST